MTSELRPAALVAHEVCEEMEEYGPSFATKVIEADRAAIIAAKDAEIAALQAHADALAGALETAKQCEASSFWGADAEKYARAAWRGAFRKVTKALRAYEEFRRG